MPPDFLFFFILWLIFFRKPDIFFNVNGRRRPRRRRDAGGRGGYQRYNWISDLTGRSCVDGRQKLHRLCHVPHRDRSRGGLRRATGQETGRQGDHVHTYTTIALSDFQQLKVDPTENVFFTSAFCNCNSAILMRNTIACTLKR